ncbi:MAG TPA: L-histidine N(alpha)-methyltransferase [Pseudonocardiaceae bacterium]|jgi:L-histidine N-alpha-methyltransferase|nr:L-histidine N(alpha)-methyltransferase [Pseudonocardiaceae bacterium]
MTAPVLDIHLSAADAAEALHYDVRVGLSAIPKWLPPKWFYDARGSELFDQITGLAEYYPTRTERELLRLRAGEIAGQAAADTLVELGSGSAEKTRLLLDALTASGSLQRFIPLDVSEAALRAAMAAVVAEYPRLAVHGVVGDFTRHLELLPADLTGHRLVAFLGGTIGNLRPPERAGFFTALHAVLQPGELLLLGAGLVTDPAVLVPAYDDAAGVTAEFNRNVLHVLNRELGADFDVRAFDHLAVWNAEQEWIEMRLRARREMTVRLPAVEMTVQFAEGEEMLTEVSGKFRRDGLTAELATCGFTSRSWWTDPDDRFALVLAAAE